MSKDVLPLVGNGTAVGGSAAGFMAYVGQYASSITVLIAILTLCVTIAAHVANARIKNKQAEAAKLKAESDSELAKANTRKIELDIQKLELENKREELEIRKLELEQKLHKKD